MCFDIFDFFQKKNKNKSTWGIIVVQLNLFVRFLEELRIPKSSFEINWPLQWARFCSLGRGEKISKGSFILVNLVRPINSNKPMKQFILWKAPIYPYEIRNFVKLYEYNFIIKLHNGIYAIRTKIGLLSRNVTWPPSLLPKMHLKLGSPTSQSDDAKTQCV